MALRKSLPAALLVIATMMASPVFSQTPPAISQAAPAPLPAVAPEGSLYARLGGTPTMTAVVGETIDKIATDPLTKASFEKVNLTHVKAMFIEQICSLTGGGCAYTGDKMRDVHAGHHITNADFFYTVEVLRDSMRAHAIPLSARNELLEILAPMKRDVVKL